MKHGPVFNQHLRIKSRRTPALHHGGLLDMDCERLHELISYRLRIKIHLVFDKKMIDLREECDESETDDTLHPGRKKEV
jgi:hypothetical protein